MPIHTTAPKASIPLLSTTFWVGSWVFSVTILLTLFVLRWWPGDRLIVVRMFNYTMPWFLVALLPLICLAGGAGRKWLLLTLLAPTLYIIFSNLPLFLPKNQSLPPSGFELKVMSYNVWSHSKDMSALAEVIIQANPDILLIQELVPKKHSQLELLLLEAHKMDEEHFAYDPMTFLGIYSIYPITTIPIKTRSSVQKSVIQTPAGPVTIYNVHFLRTVLRRSHNWQRLHDEINDLLLDEISTTSGPVILGGDFNMTDQTQTYRNISKVLKNAHWEAGSGFGFTFPSTSGKIK